MMLAILLSRPPPAGWLTSVLKAGRPEEAGAVGGPGPALLASRRWSSARLAATSACSAASFSVNPPTSWLVLGLKAGEVLGRIIGIVGRGVRADRSRSMIGDFQ
jgi:hypothetical protein